jgi:hypothetical protein
MSKGDGGRTRIGNTPSDGSDQTLIDTTKEFTRDVVVYYDRMFERGCYDLNEVDRQMRLDTLKAICNLTIVLAHIENRLGELNVDSLQAVHEDVHRRSNTGTAREVEVGRVDPKRDVKPQPSRSRARKDSDMR